MPKEAIISDRIAPPAGPFSPAIRAGGAVINAVYARHFEAPYPARTTIGVASLPLGAAVELDLIAQ